MPPNGFTMLKTYQNQSATARTVSSFVPSLYLSLASQTVLPKKKI
jgi:hypothetical protein